ncbi:MAG: beta-propeller fold lactonase family protein [Nocardioidaceae bacterium]
MPCSRLDPHARVRRRVGLPVVGALVVVALAAAACDSGGGNGAAPHHGTTATTGSTVSPKTSITPIGPPFRHPLPGMPPVLANNVYAGIASSYMSAAVKKDPALVYVPDSNGTTTTEISQRTHKIVRVLHTGFLSQHVVPSYDMRTLYVNASYENKLVALNPQTGRIERSFSVPRPYNLYFTPDGKQAVVMVEQDNTIMFADPHTFKPIDKLQVPSCNGPNHADFSGNGRFLVVTCEFSDSLVKISTLTHKVLATRQFAAGSKPQDIRISPDGTVFYVALMNADQVALVDYRTLKTVKTIATPSMPHGLSPSRNGKLLYVSDRGAGKISIVSFAKRKIVDTWTIPGGGSPDMGSVSANGKVFWISGRYDGVTYAFDTTTGKLIARIKTGISPHGVCAWPQPGRYSLGHTGNMR